MQGRGGGGRNTNEKNEMKDGVWSTRTQREEKCADMNTRRKKAGGNMLKTLVLQNTTQMYANRIQTEQHYTLAPTDVLAELHQRINPQHVCERRACPITYRHVCFITCIPSRMDTHASPRTDTYVYIFPILRACAWMATNRQVCCIMRRQVYFITDRRVFSSRIDANA